MKDNNPPKQPVKGNSGNQTISDVLRGMQHAVNSAQESIQNSQLRLMGRFFHPETGEPKVRIIKLPNGKEVSIPELVLVPQNMLLIDELEMDFSIHIASSKIKDDSEGTGEKEEDKVHVNRTSFGVCFGISQDAKKGGGKGDSIDIRIKFKATDETESTARIRDMLNKTIND